MRKTLYCSLNSNSNELSEPEIKAAIMRIRHSIDVNIVYANKRALFFDLGKITAKQVRAFFNNIRSERIDIDSVIYDKDDICHICYEIFDKTIATYNIKEKSNFRGYYTVAIKRNLRNLKEKLLSNYVNKSGKILISSSKSMLDSLYLTDLSEYERVFCEGLLNGISKCDYCISHQLTEKEYNKVYKDIKNKLKES